MTQEIEHRKSSGTVGGLPNSKEDGKMTNSSFLPSGLSASSLLENGSPIHYGVVHKLHVPIFYLLSPAWMKRTLSCWICPKSFSPQWKQRYLIAVGKYVYRFQNDHSRDPKGVPLSLQEMDTRVISLTEPQEDDMEIAFSTISPGCTAMFKVSVFGKNQYFAVSDREEAVTWTNSIQQARQESITRIMGHAEDCTYPKSWDYYDRLGDDHVKRKERIKKSLNEANKRELELSSTFSNNNLPDPTGHYG
eukprot:CAMPEP_0197828196 /NCGR_PEP_ID=MMETSP1437-20131217/4831_1 /TAXON_ID=49252 ORGANISM="Eucampia antarctica, Strain CCMP1452" /NCGR_SAMPLE_ID=MMETSP1437 /ASSEMBLY_ACC=CAM_ASM_001096 /LENGTH=247 /DNA_ID=CAMNT_0043429349 /DNA_START=34 /DNA_END=777 /DNA_ORIENTATION=+